MDFAVTNQGQEVSGLLGVTMTGADAAQFQIVSPATGDCTSSTMLTMGASCTVRIRFTPTVAGPRSAAIELSAAPGGTTSGALSGTGIAPAALTVFPTSHAFGGVLVGATSAEQSLVVTNTGAASTGTLSLSLSGADAGHFQLVLPGGSDCRPGLTTLASGTSCAVRVRFAPTARGARSAIVTITGSPGGSAVANLSGDGQNPAQLSAPPPTHDFGVIAPGTASVFRWTVSNTGDATTGPVARSISGAPAYTIVEPAGMNPCTPGIVLSAGATCNLDIRFAPQTGGTFVATLSVTASPGQSAVIDVAGGGHWTLSLAKSGAGSGSISVNGSLACDSSCQSSSSTHADQAAVMLVAKPSLGSYFVGWSGNGCSNSDRFCTVTMDQARSMTATFGSQFANIVFVSSQTYGANLGSPAAYDSQCNTLATAAGLNNAGGNAFMAWMSSSGSFARARLDPNYQSSPTIRGFARPDGVLFADDQASLFQSGRVLSPLRIDENGRDVGNGIVWTGTLGDGTWAGAGTDCQGWTSTSGGATAGLSGSGPQSWVGGSGSSCANPKRIYCFMKIRTNAVSVPAVAGLKAWISDNAFVPNTITSPDVHCAMVRPPGVANAKALVARTTAAASSAVNPAATYIRPDGMVIGTGAQIIAGGTIPNGIWQTSTGAYQPTQGQLLTWTGHSNLTALGTLSGTCDNWSSTVSQTAYYGAVEQTHNWWGLLAFGDCGSPAPHHLYCLEQP